MVKFIRIPIVLLAMLPVTATLFAQDAVKPLQIVNVTNADGNDNGLHVYVVANHPDGSPVRGLSKSDFPVLINGNAATVVDCGTTMQAGQTFGLAIVLDLQKSKQTSKLKDIANFLLTSLHGSLKGEGAQVYLVEGSQIDMERIAGDDSRQGALASRIDRSAEAGAGSIWKKALHNAVQEGTGVPNQAFAVVGLVAGPDPSTIDISDLSGKVPIFVVDAGDKPASKLERIASDSHGRYYRLDPSSVNKSSSEIASEIVQSAHQQIDDEYMLDVHADKGLGRFPVVQVSYGGSSAKSDPMPGFIKVLPYGVIAFLVAVSGMMFASYIRVMKALREGAMGEGMVEGTDTQPSGGVQRFNHWLDSQTTRVLGVRPDAQPQERTESLYRLEVSSGRLQGKVFPIQGITIVGRSQADILLQYDNSVSRRHATLRVEESGKISVEDEGSMNGTYVNGQIIQSRTTLGDNDVVSFGGPDSNSMNVIRISDRDGNTGPMSQGPDDNDTWSDNSKKWDKSDVQGSDTI